MSTRDVAVTGIGLVTPAGIGVEASWSAILDATPTAATDPALAGMPVDFSCTVPGFDADVLIGRRSAWKMDRCQQLAIVAAREAIADAGLDPASWPADRVGVVIGTGLGGSTTHEAQQRILAAGGVREVSPLVIPMLAPNMVAGHISMDCGALGPSLVTSTACASGATAIGTARDLLLRGACDLVITGGVESSLTPTVVAGFTRMKALSRRGGDPAGASRPFDSDRDGFVMAEGAGMLVLERVEHAAARGAAIRARISGYGASADAYHLTAPDPEGAGAARAIRVALADAGVGPGEVEHVNAHGTSTPLGDVAEGRMLRQVLSGQPAVTSNKGVTGHTLGAAGAIEVVCTVLTVQHGVIPPTANLDSLDRRIEVDVVSKMARHQPVSVAISNSFGFGGQNAVLVVTGS